MIGFIGAGLFSGWLFLFVTNSLTTNSTPLLVLFFIILFYALKRAFCFGWLSKLHKMAKKEHLVEGNKVKRINGLLFNAYQDYLSARVLFNSDMLMPACCLANQALEKQMKAVIEVPNGVRENSSHDTVALLNMLIRVKPEIKHKLNKEYFKALNKIYLTRYYESLPDGFRCEILRNKFLAELDYSFSILYPLVEVVPLNGPKTKTMYERDIENRTSPLFNNNYILQNIEKTQFLKNKERAIQFVIYGNSPIYALGDLSYSVDNGKFSYSGLRVISPNTMETTDWLNEEIRYSPKM